MGNARLNPAAEPGAPGVSIRGLSKAYGSVPAVTDVSFEIARGEVFGLLGPNGAGKTTTISCLTGLTAPDAGALSVCGQDVVGSPRAAKARLGVVLQSTGLQDALTPLEAIRAFAALYGSQPQAEALLASFGLTDKARAPVSSLSGGQKQRLALALALVGDPPVVVLDEPSAGLDVAARRDLHALILGLKAEGRSILLATHDMDEAARLCDRIGVLSAGRLIAQGRPAELIASQDLPFQVRARTSQPAGADLIEDLATPGPIDRLSVAGTELSFSTPDLDEALSRLLAALASAGLAIETLEAGKGGLEEAILRLSAGLPNPDAG